MDFEISKKHNGFTIVKIKYKKRRPQKRKEI